MAGDCKRWPGGKTRFRRLTVRHAFAKGRVNIYAKTARSRRGVPLRARVADVRLGGRAYGCLGMVLLRWPCPSY